LGPVSVTSATVVGGRNPAEQVRMMPWGDPAPWGDTAYQLPARQVPAHLPPWPGRLPSPAPATVLASPLRAVVVDAAGEPVEVNGRGLASAAPAWVTVGGAPPVLVVAWAGPWPVDERWWDPPAHRRRARWQVVTADGAAHLHVLESGRWLVEATYD
jgi:protein ImuB